MMAFDPKLPFGWYEPRDPVTELLTLNDEYAKVVSKERTVSTEGWSGLD